MSADDFDILDDSLFRSIVLKAAVKNKTTMKDIKETPEIPIVVEEILENGIVISTPGPSFARDHKVSINLWPDGTKERHPPSVTGLGKVIALETFNDGSEKAVIEWTQFDLEEWAKVWEVFDQRQKQVEDFLKQVKG
jgi:hypothetical protein